MIPTGGRGLTLVVGDAAHGARCSGLRGRWGVGVVGHPGAPARAPELSVAGLALQLCAAQDSRRPPLQRAPERLVAAEDGAAARPVLLV